MTTTTIATPRIIVLVSPTPRCLIALFCYCPSSFRCCPPTKNTQTIEVSEKAVIVSNRNPLLFKGLHFHVHEKASLRFGFSIMIAENLEVRDYVCALSVCVGWAAVYGQDEHNLGAGRGRGAVSTFSRPRNNGSAGAAPNVARTDMVLGRQESLPNQSRFPGQWSQLLSDTRWSS